MKFRHSTVVFAITTVVILVSCGIITTRQLSQQSRLLEGARFFTNAIAVESIASIYRNNPKNFSAELDDRLVMEVRRIAVNQDLIVAYREQMYSDGSVDNSIAPAVLAKRLLKLLGCTTASQYLTKFYTIYDQERFPQYYNDDSPESNQLRTLLEAAFAG